MTQDQAVDEMLAILKTAWDTTGFQTHYEGRKTQREEDEDPWLVVFVRHVDSPQTTLGGVGHRQFERIGTMTCQIFFPIGNGLSQGYALAKIISDAFEGVSSTSGIWFRNVVSRESPREGNYSQINVVIEFTYNEVK